MVAGRDQRLAPRSIQADISTGKSSASIAPASLGVEASTQVKPIDDPRRFALFLLTLSPLLADDRVMLRLMLREEQMLKEERKTWRIRATGVVIAAVVLASLLIGPHLLRRSAVQHDVSSPAYVMSDRSPTLFDPSTGSVPAQQSVNRYECTDGGERLLKERSCAVREGAGASGRRSEWAGTEDALRWNFRRPQ